MTSSIGNIVHVEPYSGDMLPIVARVSTESAATPSPNASTNLPTTPWRRSSSVMVRTTSVAVTPSRVRPVSRNPTTGGTSIGMGWPSTAASASIPPTPHPSTPSPLTMVVCESIPTRVSGNAAPSRSKTTLERYSRFTWWQIPVPGGTTRRFSNEPCAHFRRV